MSYKINLVMPMDLLDIKGIGVKSVQILSKLGINNVDDLLNFYPFRYVYMKRSNIDELSSGDKIIIDGAVESNPTVFYINKKLNKMTFKLNVGTNILTASIFNRGFLKEKMRIGTLITVIGKYDKKHQSISVSDIQFGLLEKERIIPVYHATNGITSKQIRSYVLQALKDNYSVISYIPDRFFKEYHFLDKKDIIYQVHNPQSVIFLKKSITQLKYEELFLFTLKIQYLNKKNKESKGLKRTLSFSKIEDFIDNLPFVLTEDQLKAINEIYVDLTSESRMNRLIQGDVGSGKTIVAFISMLMNYYGGYQSALMAPTEILAKQHYKNICTLFSDYSVNIRLLTGKLSKKDKKKIYEELENGDIDFIIGTHALFTEEVKYKNLGLVVTDEQHRFGVNQRASLKNKGVTPDILYLSATPIPRTYALTLYGDMDISSIKTIPGGRKEIITILKSPKEMSIILKDMYRELKNNHQIYVISPRIDDEEDDALNTVKKIEQNMEKAFGKLYKIGTMHGKMDEIEKDLVMEKFKQNDIQILISTTVVEVGVDVSNATMIVIFDSYKFGLSTLHQLRGRVGRNNLQSYCILISDRETERLNILTKTSDGFKISEEDFKLRGSGDLFGIRQSGDMVFKLSDLKRDYKLLLKAKDDSLNFLNSSNYTNDDKRILKYIKCSQNLD